MPRTMTQLSEEFNTTARSYLNEDVTLELLLAKYSILIRHKAATPEEKQHLTETLYNSGIEWMTAVTKPVSAIDSSMVTTLKTHLSRVTASDSIDFLPANAPEQLTDVALDLLRRAEDPNGPDSYRKGILVNLAEYALAFADKIQTAQHAARADVTTSQDIEPAKKIALKKKDDQLSL